MSKIENLDDIRKSKRARKRLNQEKEVLGFNNNFPNNILQNSSYIAFNKFRENKKSIMI